MQKGTEKNSTPTSLTTSDLLDSINSKIPPLETVLEGTSNPSGYLQTTSLRVNKSTIPMECLPTNYGHRLRDRFWRILSHGI